MASLRGRRGPLAALATPLADPARLCLVHRGPTAALIAVPLVGLLGNPVLWALLPFLFWRRDLGDLVRASEERPRPRHRRGSVPDTRPRDACPPRTEGQPPGLGSQPANGAPATLHETGGPVPNYLTLKGDGREVELGAFLSEEERIALREDLGRPACPALR